MSIEAVALDQIAPESELAGAWDEQVAQANNLYAMYQSRRWMLCARDPAAPAPQVLVGRAAGGAVTSITPIAFETVPLRFQASRRWQLKLPLRCAEVLGSQPLGAATHQSYLDVSEAIWKRYPRIEAIYFKSVPEDSDLWKVLREHEWRLGSARAYKPEGERLFHYLALPDSMDAYLGEFRKKQRYNLKRQVRVLDEAFGNTLQVECVTQPTQIPELVRHVERISQKSWKASELERAAPEVVSDPALLANIAAHGLLRSYLLKVKGEPCAYVIGYRFNRIFHYANIGYDLELSTYSPGNVLLLKVIEDVIGAGVRFFNFGITDAQYKRVFGNRHVQDAALLLLRPGMSNAMKCALHSGFQGAKAWARDRLRGARGRPVQPEETLSDE